MKSTVYDEIRQETPFARPERELAVVLLRTGDVLHHGLARALAPFDLSNEQYNALRILKGAGRAGHPTLEIARRLVSRSPNITRLLDKLIEKGLARRDRDQADRRQAVVRITPDGRELLKRCDRAVDGLMEKLLCLPTAEMKAVVAALDRVRAAVAIPTVQEELRSPRD
ncbi:MAG TPA: MarR family transcriptional regulator [Planctomycetota bacterium]|nr:MarR family transcriptional regulator [Planctomycetota bacterium]